MTWKIERDIHRVQTPRQFFQMLPIVMKVRLEELMVSALFEDWED